MNEHVCSWETADEWQIDEQTEGWIISVLRRSKHCSVCQATQFIKYMNRRKREKKSSEVPSALSTGLTYLLSGRKWVPIEKLLGSMGINRIELESRLSEWLRHGWIEVEETKEPFHDQWQIQKIRLTEKVYKAEVEEPQQKRGAQRQYEIDELLRVLRGWEQDYIKATQIWDERSKEREVINRLRDILNAQSTALINNNWVALPNTTHRPGSPLHQRWIRIIRGLLFRMASTEWEYERGFSAQWLGNSKEFLRDRQDIMSYLQVSLEQVGLYRHSPIVFCSGAFQALINGRVIDGLAGTPFIALTGESIRSMDFRTVNAEKILIIENQTAFEFILRSQYRDENCLYLYSGGFAGFGEKEWLRKCLIVKPSLNWYVWTDWDLGGVRIQMDWEHWANINKLNKPNPYLWESELIDRWKSLGKPLDHKDQEMLIKISHPLAKQLIPYNISLEQEAVLHDLPQNIWQFFS